jgi:predicted nucleic acid-binding Zn ribbon protein
MKFRLGEERKERLAPLGSLMASIIRQFNLEDSYQIEFLRREWALMVGELIATHSIPERLFKATLLVYADHSVFAAEIALMRNAILSILHERYNMKFIRNIKVEIKSFPRKIGGRLST